MKTINNNKNTLLAIEYLKKNKIPFVNSQSDCITINGDKTQQEELIKIIQLSKYKFPEIVNYKLTFKF